MRKIWMLIQRYRFFLILFAVNILLLFAAPEIGKNSFTVTKENLLEMISILPPIFVLLGLLDVWVERETMMKYMGKDAGIKGAVIAFIMGSAAAGPLYVSFPIAGMLLKKGVNLKNVFIFVGAWSTTKIPMILFEASNLGWRYMLLRFVCNVIGIAAIAVILEKSTPDAERDAIYEMAKDQ